MSRIGQLPQPPSSPRTILHERVKRSVVGYAKDYPDGFMTGRHAHQRAQLLYAGGGVLRVDTDDAGYTILPGTGLYVPARVAHAVRMQGNVEMRSLFLRSDAARAGPRGVAVIGVSRLLRELILAACAEPVSWDLRGRGRHLAALVLDEIARAPALPLALPAARDARLRRVTERLRARPDDGGDLDTLAEGAGASVRTLARLFRRETGMSFQQWRRQHRLTEALALLGAGETPARAAAAVGYASAPAFGAAFRAVFGTTPGAMTRSLMV